MEIKIREMFTKYFIGHVHVLPSSAFHWQCQHLDTILDIFTLYLADSVDKQVSCSRHLLHFKTTALNIHIVEEEK